MEILYISSVPSAKEFQHIKSQCRTDKKGYVYGMNESGFKFHTLIMKGMCSRSDVHVTSVVGRSVGRSSHKGFYWKRYQEQAGENLRYDHLGFLNFPVIKHLMVGAGFFGRTVKWLRKTRGQERAIIMDAAYVTAHPFVLAANCLSKCHTSAIFCDIYEYMGDVKDARNNDNVSFLHRMVRKLAASSYRKLDSFIFLAEEMSDVVNPEHKPYIVMEGLVDVNMQTVSNNLEDKVPQKTVMYAGSLNGSYGLKNLVEGFLAYSNPDARLWIFGAGDYEPQIREAARQDERILFGGALNLEQVVEKELQVTLMINPRPTDLEFTRYSFPSKNMEYMVSGTPILTTRLPAMPRDYYDYIYTIDGNTPADITAALEKVFALTPEELHEMGGKAREFVLTKKNNVAQAGRILDLVCKERAKNS